MPVAVTSGPKPKRVQRRRRNPDDVAAESSTPPEQTYQAAPVMPPAAQIPGAPVDYDTVIKQQQAQQAIISTQIAQQQYQDMQRRNRPAQTASATPITKRSAIAELQVQMRELKQFQAALSEFQPQPNPVVGFMNSSMGAELGKTVSSVGVELIRMIKDERAMKAAAQQMEKYNQAYERMLSKHNEALNLRAQAGAGGAEVPIPPPPQMMQPPGFPSPTGQAGQAVQLAQAYGTQPVAPTWSSPSPSQPGMGENPGFGQFGAQPMGISRPRVSFATEQGIPGMGAQQPLFPGAPVPLSPEQQIAALQAQLERANAEKAKLEDQVAFTKPKPAAPPADPADDANVGIEGEGVNPEYIAAQQVPAVNPAKKNPSTEEEAKQ